MTTTRNESSERASYYVLGETLRPLITNRMGSAIEIFDTRGPAGGGPPPHRHPWEEVYYVIAGQLEVQLGQDEPSTLSAGDFVHIPAGTRHRYSNLTDDCHFLTILSRGNGDRFFEKVSREIEMNPPDIEGVLRVGRENGIEFEV
jgi:quercetin dioxygenase-like cupin family protein